MLDVRSSPREYNIDKEDKPETKETGYLQQMGRKRWEEEGNRTAEMKRE